MIPIETAPSKHTFSEINRFVFNGAAGGYRVTNYSLLYIAHNRHIYGA